MPSKIQRSDWDRLFAPNAPRRGGPLSALVNVLITAVVLALLVVGWRYGRAFIAEQQERRAATATVVAATLNPLRTATAIAAAQATALAEATPTPTSGPTPEPSIGSGIVVREGNLRSEPRVADDTRIGLLLVGDQIDFLEQRSVGGQSWFRIRVSKAAPDRNKEGVAEGTVGWAAAVVVSPITPVPAPSP